LFGISFKEFKDHVKIITACNLGASTNDAGKLDPAFAARFSIMKKLEYDENDVESFKRYMEKQDYSPYIKDFINSQSTSTVLQFMQSIEERALETACPSLRAFADLDTHLKAWEDNKLLTGTILFSNSKMDIDYQNLVMDKPANCVKSIESILDEFSPKLDNWAALGEGETINHNNVGISAEEIVSDLKEAIALFKSKKYSDQDLANIVEVIKVAHKLDVSMIGKREGVFRCTLGDASKDFLSYFNTVSGNKEEVIEIPDLKDITNIPKFFKVKLGALVNTDPVVIVDTAVVYTKEFLDYFNDTLSPKHYQDFINSALDYIPNRDSGALFIHKVSNSEQDKIFDYCNDVEDSGFVKALILRVSKPVSDEELKQTQEKNKSKAKPRSTRKPTLIK
jgi:hypothetical protein